MIRSTAVTASYLLAVAFLAFWLLPGCAQQEEPTQTSEEQAISSRTLPEPQSALVLDPDSANTLAPGFVLPQLGGGTLRLIDYRGRVVLLNFWATWCPPCRAEIPDLNRLQDELGPKGLEVIGVSLDEEGFDAVRPFAETHEVTYPLVVDDGAVAAQYGSIQGLPTTLVIDRNGRIVRRVIGLFPVDEMQPLLEELLMREYRERQE